MIVSFKFYVMNFVEIVIDFYSHITSHVSQAFASCTHYTKFVFVKLDILYCVWSCRGHPRLKFLDFDANVLNVWVFEDNLFENLDFGKSRLNSSVFEKLFVSYSCPFFFFLNNVLWGVSALKCYVFQKYDFARLSIDRTCFSINQNCH